MPTVSYSIVDTVDDVSYAPGLGLDVSGPAQGDYGIAGLPPISVGFRFRAIAVPAGATITSATLTLTRSSHLGGASLGRLHGAATDNVALWTSTGPALVPKTTESVVVTSGATVAYNVTAIVQAIVSRAGWTAGNALGFAGDPTGSNGAIVWVDYQTNPTQAAKLSITYEEGVSIPVARPTFQAMIIG